MTNVGSDDAIGLDQAMTGDVANAVVPQDDATYGADAVQRPPVQSPVGAVDSTTTGDSTSPGATTSDVTTTGHPVVQTRDV